MRNHRTEWRLFLPALLVLVGPSCSTVGEATIDESLQKHSLEMAQQLEQSGALVDDPELTAYVRSIGERLVEQADAPAVTEFNFAVLNDASPNAFSIPSGHIYISRGLLVLLGDEAELAGVLGHEIGHVLKQHSLKQATGQVAFAPIRVATRIAGGLVGLALPGVGNVVKATGELPAALTGASYGRSQENEADEVGQRLAAGASWDPIALSRVMDALARQQTMRGQDPAKTSWFATHPASPDRAARIRGRADELSVGASRPVAASPAAFLSKLEGLVVGSSARNGVFDGSEFLHPELGFALRFPAGEDWTQINTEEAVAVVRKAPVAAVILGVVAKGDDALAVARAFEPEAGKLDAPVRGETVNGLRTAHATGGDAGGFGREPIRASARWIAHGGLVYRILSESTESGYALFAKDFAAAERSFRTLSSADRQRILENRLHIETARKGETLAALLERVGSDWDLEEAAAANGIDSSASFGRGDSVKITRKEPFVSSH
ncbi:MAG: M48 family metalloprotease [Deltaproteobacteria bacterium]|nr:M48 family metalloprotease [Deltaproteobacteria bacterium]